MRKIIIAVLALTVACIFTATPAKAEEDVVEKATMAVMETALEVMPEKVQTLARFAYWLGDESGRSVGAGKMIAPFAQALEHIDLTEEQRMFVEAVFLLGAASAVDELEDDEELAPAEGLHVTSDVVEIN